MSAARTADGRRATRPRPADTADRRPAPATEPTRLPALPTGPARPADAELPSHTAPSPLRPAHPSPAAERTAAERTVIERATPERIAVRVPPGPGAERIRALAQRAGLRTGGADPHTVCVGVVVAPDADRALRAPRPTGPVLFVCDTVTPEGRRRALRTGAVVVAAAGLTPDALLHAVHRAARPLPSIPWPELSGLLSTGMRCTEPGPGGAPRLTARQISVLRLMAEGHGNADIARLLGCSEHTVKNVVYEVMARLQARNRAHAVAHAVRGGLV